MSTTHTHIVYNTRGDLEGAYSAVDGVAALNAYASDKSINPTHLIMSEIAVRRLEGGKGAQVMQDRISHILNTIVQEGGALSAAQVILCDIAAATGNDEPLAVLVDEIEALAVLWFDEEISRRQYECMRLENEIEQWLNCDWEHGVMMRTYEEIDELKDLAVDLGLRICS